MTLGKSIRAAREEIPFSQYELAKRMGVSRQAVHKWETGGVPRRKYWKLLEEVLCLPHGWLWDNLDEDLQGRYTRPRDIAVKIESIEGDTVIISSSDHELISLVNEYASPSFREEIHRRLVKIKELSSL